MHKSSESGTIIPTILILLLFLSITVLSLGLMAESNITRSTGRIYGLQAQYAAESGSDVAIAYLNSAGVYSDSGTEKTIYQPSGQNFRATYQTTVSDVVGDVNKKTALSIGRVYLPSLASSPRFTYKLKATFIRTSTESASNMMSRNTLKISSAVKEVLAKKVFINKYIQTAKNVNKVTVGELTVGDAYPSSAQCSLYGSGKIQRDPSLPPGTKAIVKLHNNSCMAYLGSLSDFDMTQNDTTIRQIASIDIPWSFKMNNNDNLGEYTAAGNCSDLTASSPSIPSIGNNRKTHYPNTAGGITAPAQCGGGPSTGEADINLGTKTINVKDHAHIRAHLCLTSACSPTFNNPTADIKFVFVEGVINFDNIITSSGSGPIVFVSYHGGKTIGNCSGSTAIRLGKNGEMIAPKAFFIATNGALCVDSTKFGANPALGGISGKDLYIDSNSGTPFDLSFDASFPTNAIPVNLSWRTTSTQRLY